MKKLYLNTKNGKHYGTEKCLPSQEVTTNNGILFEFPDGTSAEKVTLEILEVAVDVKKALYRKDKKVYESAKCIKNVLWQEGTQQFKLFSGKFIKKDDVEIIDLDENNKPIIKVKETPNEEVKPELTVEEKPEMKEEVKPKTVINSEQEEPKPKKKVDVYQRTSGFYEDFSCNKKVEWEAVNGFTFLDGRVIARKNVNVKDFTHLDRAIKRKKNLLWIGGTALGLLLLALFLYLLLSRDKAIQEIIPVKDAVETPVIDSTKNVVPIVGNDSTAGDTSSQVVVTPVNPSDTVVNGLKYRTLIEDADWMPIGHHTDSLIEVSLANPGNPLFVAYMSKATGEEKWYMYLDGKRMIADEKTKKVFGTYFAFHSKKQEIIHFYWVNSQEPLMKVVFPKLTKGEAKAILLKR